MNEEVPIWLKADKKQKPKEDVSLYKKIAYIPFLWLVSFSKISDRHVKFHIGQGITLTLFLILLFIILLIINGIITGIFSESIIVFGVDTGEKELTLMGSILIIIANVIYSVIGLGYILTGIRNSNLDDHIKLPLIGKFAFYK